MGEGALGQELLMVISQKCQYGLRGVFELARRAASTPVRIADIAEAQAIPVRFLEVILGQLKQGGFVESRRGNEGGYMLAKAAAAITVGDVIRFIDGPIGPVKCVQGAAQEICPLRADCVFLDMWEEARRAVSRVYDDATLADLVERDRERQAQFVNNFSI